MGCGTKLPHNVTSLLGVMDGAASDLRTGLPWQMVEIHEPVRLLFVIETTPEVMLEIMERKPALGQFARNGWVQVAVLDPQSSQIQVFRDGEFEPYEPEATACRAPDVGRLVSRLARSLGIRRDRRLTASRLRRAFTHIHWEVHHV